MRDMSVQDKLTIYSFNCRGLGNRVKRASIFEWLMHSKGDIYFLQETHSSFNTESSWQQQWGGNLIFSHGESNSRGVAILRKLISWLQICLILENPTKCAKGI